MTEPLELSLQRDQLHKQIADQIQDLVIARSLHPGDKLPGERELADQLGISRTVVREAIRTLSVRGLIRVKPGCGTYIEALTPEAALASIELFLRMGDAPKQLDDLYEIRRMVEIEVAGLAAERATEEDLASLAGTIEGMVADRDEPEAFTKHDMTFHSALAAATHNGLFSALMSPIANLWLEAIRISYHAPGAVERGIKHHRTILGSIERGDREAARLAMGAHIHDSQSQVAAVRDLVGDS